MMDLAMVIICDLAASLFYNLHVREGARTLDGVRANLIGREQNACVVRVRRVFFSAVVGRRVFLFVDI
jgi:hypothetical protein